MDSFLKGRESISDNELTGNNKITQEKEKHLQSLNVTQEIQKPESGDAMQNAKIETVFESGLLKKIVIHCDCGKELILNCQY